MKRMSSQLNKAIVHDQFESWDEVITAIRIATNWSEGILHSDLFIEIPFTPSSGAAVDEEASDWWDRSSVAVLRRACTNHYAIQEHNLRRGPRATATALWCARNNNDAMWAIMLCAYAHDGKKRITGAGRFVLDSAAKHARAMLDENKVIYGWHHGMTGALPGAFWPESLMKHADLSHANSMIELFVMEVCATLSQWQLVKIVDVSTRTLRVVGTTPT